MYYTGVGSRDITDNEKAILIDIGEKLAKAGMFLRSGGANGSDTAFFDGVCNVKTDLSNERIYVPWQGFNSMLGTHILTPSDLKVADKCEEIASSIHPAWHRCSRGAKMLHSRNVLQVLGDDLDSPSNFLICCSPPARNGVKGGTNTAVQLAIKYNVPWFNVRVIPDMVRLNKLIKELSNE